MRLNLNSEIQKTMPKSKVRGGKKAHNKRVANRNRDFWYNKGIFELYLEHKKLEHIHRLTKIPKYSLRETLKEMKLWINNKWIDYSNGKES